MNVKNKILQFLNTQTDCVIASVGPDGQPQSATIGFAENDKLQLVFGTSRNSRKAQNIARDSRVAVVFGFSGGTTVQYEGEARVLESRELEDYQNVYFQKQPQTKSFKDSPEQIYLIIEPRWIRYTNYTSKPVEIEEMRQFS